MGTGFLFFFVFCQTGAASPFGRPCSCLLEQHRPQGQGAAAVSIMEGLPWEPGDPFPGDLSLLSLGKSRKAGKRGKWEFSCMQFSCFYVSHQDCPAPAYNGQMWMLGCGYRQML